VKFVISVLPVAAAVTIPPIPTFAVADAFAHLVSDLPVVAITAPLYVGVNKNTTWI
jgi:hypothetical protein